jgi:hypothetical protein
MRGLGVAVSILACGCPQSVEVLPLGDAGPLLPVVIGAACAGSCGNGLICFTSTNTGLPFPGGFCSTPCDETSDCLQGALCGTVGQTALCLPPCDSDPGEGCRDGGYACCVGPSLDAGACAPSPSDFCG